MLIDHLNGASVWDRGLCSARSDLQCYSSTVATVAQFTDDYFYVIVLGFGFPKYSCI